jgi:hypothetical protein
MKVDLSKLDILVIADENGKVVDSFPLHSATLTKSKLTGTILEIRKKGISKPKTESNG